ncbi:MFS transporter [Acrocarpospora macrocephala]|uniref:MFS transporter n=1 Tax=Acrocarpospora macrocephala TaxID=150177 RepID=A0A5M3WR33_9ACTN|nr:MFS transporter [Acrocarpospora macrocephala]GES10612.1 MFS transporter [Acrocarpospora macrocephala]
MEIEPYRRVLAEPGVRNLLLVGLLARIPHTATSLVLTLHTVKSLGMTWTQAGLVGASATIGMALGSPITGRFIDRRGVRPVVVVTMLAQFLFWVTAWALPYPALLVLAGVSGLLMLPVFGVIRQCLAAMVPAESHRTGFALDSMATETSFMIGPAVAAAGVSALSSTTAMAVIGVGFLCSGLALFALNPPTRSAAELAAETGEHIPRRQWLTPRLLTVLAMGSTLCFVLTATDLAIVATLEDSGATGWIGPVISIWCLSSLVGGFVYGGLSRGFSPLAMIAVLSALTIPVGLVGGGWWWLCLALIPSGLLCAPSQSATVNMVNRWAPTAVRGEVMGLHGTFLTIGIAVAGPIAGAIIDGAGPAWAFAGAGLIGLAVVAAAAPIWRKAPKPVLV